MKNKVYIIWCFLVCLIPYSITSHVIWHTDGLLYKFGFMDAAGAIVIHGIGGCASLISLLHLGPRHGMLKSNGILKSVPSSDQPIIVALGTFILWYGWFAFNISSPITAGIDLDGRLGIVSLVTMIGPVSASLSGMMIMLFYYKDINLDSLISCVIAGLVSITGNCYTIGIWSAIVIGMFSPVIYFISAYIVRNKLKIDDPLQILSVHLVSGIYSIICEGIFANDTVGHPGLIYGGYIHCIIQIIGGSIMMILNLFIMYILYHILLRKIIFKGTSLRVTVLNTYLGTELYIRSPEIALNEVTSCKTSLSRQLLFTVNGTRILYFLICFFLSKCLKKCLKFGINNCVIFLCAKANT